MVGFNDWKLHYQALTQKGLQPATTLRRALDHLEAGGSTLRQYAIDLGCGNGIDTLFLLAQGWDVLAIDKEPMALKSLRAGGDSTHLATSLNTFEEMVLPKASLVNASFALPFCRPAQFTEVWSKIRASIREGGYFSGHFFGPRDSWSDRKDMIFHSREEVKELLAGFDIFFFEETEKDGKTIGGIPKHWHVFHVAAKAPAP